MFRKLHLQLTTLCVLVISVILLSMTAIVLHLVRQNEELRYFQNFEDTMDRIYQELSSQTSLSHSWLEEISNENNLVVSILDNGMPLLFHRNSDNTDMEPLFSQARRYALDSFALSELSIRKSNPLMHREFWSNTSSGNKYLASVAYLLTGSGVLNIVVLSQPDTLGSYMNGLYPYFILLTICVILLLSLFSFFLIRYLLHPLEKGHIRQVSFFAGASHELRSPLAVIISSLSAMESCPERSAEFLQIIGKESLRMQRLVNDMFTLSSLDNGSIAIHREKTCLDTLFLDAYEKFEGLAIKKRIFFELSIPDEPLSQAFCDPERMAQVFTILFDNAVSYTPEGGHILASIMEKHSQFIFTVSDNGPGIPDTKKKEVFSRFYRCDQSRTDKNHFGLGLSIAKEIVELHGGTISANDSKEGGAEFTIRFPVYKNIPHIEA